MSPCRVAGPHTGKLLSIVSDSETIKQTWTQTPCRAVGPGAIFSSLSWGGGETAAHRTHEREPGMRTRVWQLHRAWHRAGAPDMPAVSRQG